ncbi:Phytoene dehydrogenase [Caenispirillum salinarum AK4]|uniref:Phytoene dehydrogenase n=1 Tax=Caenispirillum salinarum AK4 TaxID=1238182 RepID=K9H5I3_9PROT|nr:Phytoene dehydrogenase [Caenispirillum salinarum AK4]
MTVMPPPRDLSAAYPAADMRPHAVVIGSGFGGLAAAVRLGARGYRVTVLERLDQPGGRANVFHQDGHVFDAGPTIVTAPFLLEELWSLCGRRLTDDVTLVPMHPFYRIRFDDGATFAASADADAMRVEVERLAPADVAGYERFFREAADIYRVGFEKLGAVPFGSAADMLRCLPDLIRMGAHRSVWRHVASCVKDERLRTALSFHPLFIGGDPFSVTCVYSLIAYLERRDGVHFAMGGTHSIVRGLVGLIEGQGNAVRLKADVAEIITRDGRAAGVVLADGEAIAADVVVSNADTAWTYSRLLKPEARRRWTDAKVRRARQSMGVFLWYFGTDRQWPEVDHHTIVLGPRYKGLLTDIFGRKALAGDMSLYLHRPTATDPGLAPPGRDTFYALSPVPNLSGGETWSAERVEAYRRAVEKRLEETVLPGLPAHVSASRVATPVHFRDRYKAWHGAAFGMEPVLTQSAWFRPHNASEDVAGLFIVGAGTHPGAGLPGVLSSAKILDEVVPHASTVR